MAKDAITDRVWHIITNEAAIAVNQDWAGSPGYFVRELGVNNNTDTNNSVVAVACTSGDPTQVGWAYDDSGHRVTLDLNRQLLSQCLHGSRGRDHLVDNCHAQYGAADDKYCLDHTNADNLEVQACQGIAAQELEFDGKYLRDKEGLCVDVYEGHGPQVQLYKCHHGPSQALEFKDGRLVEKKEGLCFAVRQDMYGPQVQLWVKPLSCKGCRKVAAFIVSNQDVDDKGHAVHNRTYTIDLAKDLGMEPGVPVHVSDVWLQKEIGVHNGPTFSTDALGGHDSRFYVMTTSTVTV